MKTLIILNWCYGIARPQSPVSCPEVYKVGHKIVSCAHLFDSTIIFNDLHNPHDNELKYLPEHLMFGTADVQPMQLDGLVKPMILHKRGFNPVGRDQTHNRLIMSRLDIKQAMVAGFNGLTDIIPACLSLMDFVPEILVAEECFGDLSILHKQRATEYLQFLGIPVIKGEVNDKSFSVFKR